MFRFPQRAASAAATPDRSRHLLRRALLFGAALILLWLALQLAPKRTPAPPPVPIAEVAEADAGVAVRSRPASPSLFSAGNIVALALLAGGIGLAFFMRRRARESGTLGMPLETLGHLSLAQNQQLRLVRCGDDVLLLGVTSGQITLLKAYEADAFAEASEAASPAQAPQAAQASEETSFASLLRQQVGTSLTFQKSEAT